MHHAIASIICLNVWFGTAAWAQVGTGDLQAEEDEAATVAAAVPSTRAETVPPAPSVQAEDSAVGVLSGHTLSPAQHYQRALDAMLRDRYAEASAHWQQYLAAAKLDGALPKVAEAEAFLWFAQAKLALESQAMPDSSALGIGKAKSGRAELVIFSSLYGIWSGIALSVLLDTADETLLFAGLGGVAGLATSLWLTSDRPITPEQARATSMGGSWGTWNGLAVAVAADPSGQDPEKVIVGSALAGGFLGIGAGIALSHRYAYAGDELGLVNSAGAWGTFVAGMTLLITNVQPAHPREVFIPLLAGSDLGMVGGAWASQSVHISEGRLNYINLGGALGALLGGGVLLSARDNIESSRSVGWTMLGSAAAGMAAGTFFTRNMDSDATAWQIVPQPWVAATEVRGIRGLEMGLGLTARY